MTETLQKSHRIVLACALIVAACMYTVQITGDLYGDESGQTYDVVAHRHFWSNLLHPSMCHPPLYFILAKGCYELTGQPWGIRIPSILFGLGTIVLVAFGARRYLGGRYFVPALCLSVLSPFLNEFAREGRAYAMLIFFSGALLWTFLAFLERENFTRLALLAIAAIGGALTHFFFWFQLIAVSVVYLSVRRRVTKYAAGAAALVALFIAPVFIIGFLIQGGAFRGWLQVPWAETYFSIPNFLGRLAVALSFGYSTFRLPSLDPGRNVALVTLRENWLPVLGVVCSFLGLAYAWVRLALYRTKGLWFLLFTLIVPIALSLIAVKLGFYLVREKHLAIVWVPYFFLLLMGLRYLAHFKVGWVVIASYGVIVLLSFVHYFVYPHEYSRRMDWTSLNRTLEARVATDDVIVYFRGYIQDLSLDKLTVLKGSTRQVDVAEATSRELPLEEIVGSVDRTTRGAVFLISNETDRHAVDPGSSTIRELGKHRLRTEMRFGRNLVLYEFRPSDAGSGDPPEKGKGSLK